MNFYVFRTLSGLGLDRLSEEMMAAAVQEAGPGLGRLEERLLADEHAAQLAKLQREVEAEVRRRLVESARLAGSEPAGS
jgi:hypothetical protein